MDNFEFINDPQLKSKLNSHEPPFKFKTFDSIDAEDLAGEMVSQSQRLLNKQENEVKVERINGTLQEIVSQLNTTYNLNLNIDFNNFNNTLKSIVDPTNKRVLELYVSEIFGRFRVTQYIKLIQAVALLSDEILKVENLLDPKYSLEDRFGMTKQLFDFMLQLELIWTEIEVKSSALELKGIGNAKVDDMDTDPEVARILNEFRTSVITKSEKPNGLIG